MRRLRVALVLGLIMTLIPAYATAAAVKAGSPCVKVKAKRDGLVCQRVKGKLVWVPVAMPVPKTQPKPITSADLRPGLLRTEYAGYHGDDISWFSRQAPRRTEVEQSTIEIKTGVDDYFSIRWTGYFIPTESGHWQITTSSDDGSYLWLGASAIDAAPTRPALLSAPGIHGPVRIFREVYLVKGQVYPLRLHFGDAYNWAEMVLSIKAPSAVKESTALSGLVWHSPTSTELHSGIDSAFSLSTSPSAQETGTHPVITQASLLSPLTRCQIPAGQGAPEARKGFPRSPARLPASGTIRGIVLFVEFSDIKGDSRDVENRFKAYTERASLFYQAQSYGRLTMTYDKHPAYIPIPGPSSKYGMQKHNGGDPGLYFRDALDAADPVVDFTPYDLVVVIPPIGTDQIVYGPAFPMAMDNPFLRTNEKVILNGTVAGRDSIENPRGQWQWLAHEVGHLFGLEHQYSWNITNYDRLITGMWDLMDGGDVAPELLAWHRFLVGWLGEGSIRCLDAISMPTETTHLITPIASQAAGEKAVIIRLNEKEALAIEVRRFLGFDQISEFDEGVLVYLVNAVDRDSTQEALILNPRPLPQDAVIAGTMKPGEVLTYGNIEIAVLHSDAQGDSIRVRRLR